MTLISSDELVLVQSSRKKTSVHSNCNPVLLTSHVVQDMLNVHAVVSIGASSDEEELLLSDVSIDGYKTYHSVAENRNDEEMAHACSMQVQEIRHDESTADRGTKDSQNDVNDGNMIYWLHSAASNTSIEDHSKTENTKGESNNHIGTNGRTLEIGVEIVDPDKKCYTPTDQLQNTSIAMTHRGSYINFGLHPIQDNICLNSKRSWTAGPASEANVSEPCLVADCQVEYRTENQKSLRMYPLDIILSDCNMTCERKGKLMEHGDYTGKEEESSVLPSNGNDRLENIHRSYAAADDKEIESTTDDNSKLLSPLISILKTFPVSQSDAPRHTRLRFFQRRGRPALSMKPKSCSCFHQKPVVTFSFITIRTYPIILGDHPSCKFGAPISIGWDYHECQSIPVDVFEHNRTERRRMKQLYLNSGCRRMILKGAGFSIEQISNAINDVQMIQLQRKESTNDEVGILSFFNGVKNQSTIKQVGDYVNMKGWKKNKTPLWSRVLEQHASGKLKSWQAKQNYSHNAPE